MLIVDDAPAIRRCTVAGSAAAYSIRAILAAALSGSRRRLGGGHVHPMSRRRTKRAPTAAKASP